MSELTRRYAQALYQVCPDEDGLRETAGALMGDAALWEALTSPAVEPEKKGRVLARCVVTCARAPGEEELNKLRAALCRLHHKKDIQFDIRVEPALLGGFTLDIEGVTYDKSVRGALRRLERQLEERRMA